MATSKNTYTDSSSGSTTWEWRRVKISQRRRPLGKAAAAGRPSALESRDLREPITLLCHFRGGQEAWWEVRARGRTFHFIGPTALHDVMCTINNRW